MIVTSEIKIKSPFYKIEKITFKCFIDTILHFSIDITKNVAFVYAYTDKNMYYIEITDYNNKLLKLEYDSKEKWELILKEIDKIL